ncbi:MAG TPA: response regulator [Kofleriaceae bacterium]|nr:response regulator [Kofleriaceae bacterium]
MSAEAIAIVVAPEGATGPLEGIVERLTSTNIVVHVVEDVPSAALIASRTPSEPPCVLLDLRDLSSGSELEDVKQACERVRKAAHAIQHTMPVAVTSSANAGAVVALVRAGAGDVIDLQLEGIGSARAVVVRVYHRQVELSHQVYTARALRSMIEDMLKDLIRTERRSIDLEEKLAQFESVTGETGALSDQREPAILLVEQDLAVAREIAERLEAEGLSTFAYTSGEEAARELDTLLAGGTGFDLALIAAQLPGIDGLETVRRLRDQLPGLPAFLMTAVHDADLAARAADLGVVGFVQKPLPDIDEVVARLSQLAREALDRTREQLYLQRIKARHERVLARYRSLPR